MSAVTQNSYIGNGSTTNYSFTFPYLKSTDVEVQVDATVTTAWQFANATTVQFNTAPANGAKIKILRQTNVDSLTATFYAGSAIKSEDLNDNYTQNLYKTQEIGARFFSNTGGTMTGDLTMAEDTSLIFEGATDDNFETVLAVADPTADRTVTIPNVTGTLITTGDTDTVTASMLANDCIDNANKIANDVINSEHYVAGSIDLEHMSANSVDSDQYVDGSIDHVHLAADCIDGDNIQNDVINSEHYAPTSIDTEHIGNQQVTTAKLDNDAVTTAKLADNAVVTANIADAAVTSAKIVGGNITTAKLGSQAVTTAKIADSNVTTAKIADDAVTTAKIADAAVGGTQLNSNAVTTGKISNTSVTTSKIADDAITADKIADDAVRAEHIQANAVTDSEIATGTLDNRYFTETELTSGALDGRYFTETESDARYFNISTGDTIKDGDTFPDNDTTIATTAAINDRIIDLVDDVGGFVPIANELSFPNANPDVNNGTGTLVSIKALSQNLTSNGSGQISISNGTVGNSTVTITGAANSTTYAATFGMIVETTSTLNTYTFHRLVPKATEVSTVSGSISNVNTVAGAISNVNTAAGNITNINTVAGINANVTTVAGISSDVTTVANNNSNVTAVADNSSNINSAVANASNINSAVSNASNINSAVSNASNINSAVSNASNINTVAGSISNVNTAATNIASINTTASNIADVNNFTDRYQVASSNPSTDGGGNALAEGDLYFNTTSNELKVYNGGVWQGGVTATGNFAVTTGNTFSGNNIHNDDVKALFGTGSDLEIYHNGTDTYIENNTGNLFINHGNDKGVKVEPNAKVQLFYDNDLKLETLSTGTKVYGNITVTGNVDGRDVAADGTKLDGIETAATADQTASEIVALVADQTIAPSGIAMGDSEEILLGAGNDFKFRHDGTDNHIVSANGDINIQVANGEDAIIAKPNGAVELYHDANKKLETISTGAQITGSFVPSTDANRDLGSSSLQWQNIYLDNDLIVGDNGQAIFGDGSDLKFYHNGTNSFIENSTGSLYIRDTSGGDVRIQGKSGEDSIICHDDGGVELYHDDTKKFETTSGGATVTGNLAVTGTVDGRDVATDGTKLDGIAASANNYSHPNHSGDITSSGDGVTTITGNAVNTSKLADSAVTQAKIANNAVTTAKIADGTITGAKIAGDTITLPKLEDIGQNTFLARISSGNGDVEEISASQARSALNVENGATADQSASEILNLIKTVDGSGSGLDADTLDGSQASTTSVGSTIVRRHSSGYIYANFFNTSPNVVTSGITRLCVETGSDGFIRHSTAGGVKNFLDIENFSDSGIGSKINSDTEINGQLVTQIGTASEPGIAFGGADRDTGFYRDVGGNINVALNGNAIYRFTTSRFQPEVDNQDDLGGSSRRWDDVRATNGNIQTSDRNAKNTITTSDLGLDFVNKLTPVSYKFNEVKSVENGETDGSKKSGTRTHYGLIAQDIETLLGTIGKSATDFAGFCKDEKDEKGNNLSEPLYGLRYTEFISPIIKAIQELSAKVAALEAA